MGKGNGEDNGDWSREKKWVLGELERLSESLAELDKRLVSMEVKVGVLVAKVMGVSAFIALVAGAVITVLIEFVFKK